jgi:hypothetical protein
MARPLYYDGSNLKEMSDAQLERIAYYLQVAYADQLYAGGVGSIYVGTTGTGSVNIGNASDQSSTQRISSRAAPSNDGITQTYPAYPGIGGEVDTFYYYRQYRNYPNFPSDVVLDSASFLCLDADNNIQVANNEGRLRFDLIEEAIAQMKTNEVGTYRVSASTPTNGGAGTWSDKGTWFIDSRYNNVGNTTYKLWVKRSLTTVPGSDVFPAHLKGSTDFHTIQSMTASHYMIQDVLLPMLTREFLYSATALRYEVGNSAGTYNKGNFSDTKYIQRTDDRYTTGTGMSEVYYSRSTPLTTGTTTTIRTKYLNLLG